MKIIASIGISFYLFMLALGIGAVLASGVLVAPVIFEAYKLLPESGITNYDSGIIMTKIFVRLGYGLNALALIILITELFVFNIASKKSLLLLGLGALNVILIFTFTLYYTPAIIELQQEGPASTGTLDFEGLHTQSKMIMEILFVTLSASFLWRITSMRLALPLELKQKQARTTRTKK